MAGGGHPEQEGGKVLPDRGGGRVIQRTIGPVIAEGKQTVRITGAELRFAVLPNIGPELQRVFALQLREAFKDLENVEGQFRTAGVAQGIEAARVEGDAGHHLARSVGRQIAGEAQRGGIGAQ